MATLLSLHLSCVQNPEHHSIQMGWLRTGFPAIMPIPNLLLGSIILYNFYNHQSTIDQPSINHNLCIYGGFLKWGIPKFPWDTMGFNTKMVQFRMIWGYSHSRKPPCTYILVFLMIKLIYFK
jgi:hypothetical protein